MASNRSRANTTIGTRINDVYRRLNAQESASRGTTEEESMSNEEVTESLENLGSGNFLLQKLAQVAPQLLADGGKKITDWNDATTIGHYWADGSAANAPTVGITIGAVYSYGPDGTDDRRMQEVYTPSASATDQVKSWRRVSMTGATGWTGWVEVSGSGSGAPVVNATETQAGIAELSNATEAVLNPGPTNTIMTPQRVKDAIDTFAPAAGRGQTSIPTTDWNTATKTGFYQSSTTWYDFSTSTDKPVGNLPPGVASDSHFTGVVINDSSIGVNSGQFFNIVQEIWEYTNPNGGTGAPVLLRKWSRSGWPQGIDTGPWSAWRSDEATATQAGRVELATNAEALAGTDTARAVTPAGLSAAITAGGAAAVPVATTTVQGKIALATNAEVQTGTDAAKAVTAAALTARTATETRTGIVELATVAETTTGTDTVRAVTPAGVKAVADTKSGTGHTHVFSTLTSIPEAWPAIATKPVTDLASTYPVGSTIMFINNVAGWPGSSNYGVVRTDKAWGAGGGTVQYWTGYNTNGGELWMRQTIFSSTAWNAWQRLDRVPFSTQLEAQLNPGATDTMMTPQRVKDSIDTFSPVAGRGQTAFNVTDWNTATKTGFYRSTSGSGNGVTNYPPGTEYNYYTGFVTNDSNYGIGSGSDEPVTQVLWEYEALFGSPGAYTPVRTWWRGGMPAAGGTYTWSAWKSSDASETQRGMVEMATIAEAVAGVDPFRAVTPAGVAAAVPTATTSVSGKSPLATNAEAIAGTNATKAVTPAALAAAVPAATTAVAGKSMLALWTEVQAGTDGVKVVTPAGLNSRTATDTRTGLVELATIAETTTGTDTTRAVTPAGVAAAVAGFSVPSASETVQGKIELATLAEVKTASDTVRAVTPSTLKQSLALPNPWYATGPSSTTITAAAGSWANVAGAVVTITPERALIVDVALNAICRASTGYSMIGVNIEGGLVLDPSTAPDGTTFSGWTPFTSSTVDTAISSPTKRVTIPGGVATTFTMWTRRNVASGTQVTNYPILQIFPVAWA